MSTLHAISFKWKENDRDKLLIWGRVCSFCLASYFYTCNGKAKFIVTARWLLAIVLVLDPASHFQRKIQQKQDWKFVQNHDLYKQVVFLSTSSCKYFTVYSKSTENDDLWLLSQLMSNIVKIHTVALREHAMFKCWNDKKSHVLGFLPGGEFLYPPRRDDNLPQPTRLTDKCFFQEGLNLTVGWFLTKTIMLDNKQASARLNPLLKTSNAVCGVVSVYSTGRIICVSAF